MKPIWGWSLRISWWKFRRIIWALQINLTDWAIPLRISGPSSSDPEQLLGLGLQVQFGPIRVLIARISGKNWQKLLSKTFVWGAVNRQVNRIRASNKRRRRGTAR